MWYKYYIVSTNEQGRVAVARIVIFWRSFIIRHSIGAHTERGTPDYAPAIILWSKQNECKQMQY